MKAAEINFDQEKAHIVEDNVTTTVRRDTEDTVVITEEHDVLAVTPKVPKENNYRWFAGVLIVWAALTLIILQNPNYSANLHNYSLASSIAMIWAGMLLGISFLATRIPFEIPGLPFFGAVDIGRRLAASLNRVESVFAAVIALAMQLQPLPAVDYWLLLIPIGLLVFEILWLQPKLDHRARNAMLGVTERKVGVRYLYLGCEILKTLCLIVFATRFVGWCECLPPVAALPRTPLSPAELEFLTKPQVVAFEGIAAPRQGAVVWF